MNQSKWYENSYRRFLLDFHIDDWNKGFLSRFDPDEYAACVELARGTAATVLANTHTGLCNYPTRVGRMHHQFEGRDVLRETIAALHRRNIHRANLLTMSFRWTKRPCPHHRAI